MVGAGLEVGRRLETTIAYQLQAKTRGTFTLTTPRPLPGESPKATVSSTPFFGHLLKCTLESWTATWSGKRSIT